MLIDAIDVYHFISLSVTLALAGGQKVSTNKNPVGFIFSHTFQLKRMKFSLWMKQFKLKILILILKENN